MLGLTYHEAAQLAVHRDREGGVLRVEHQSVLQFDAVMGQPFLQARGVPASRESTSTVDIEGRGGQHHRAATHQELIQCEQLLLVQLLRCGQHQQVGLIRHLTAAADRS